MPGTSRGRRRSASAALSSGLRRTLLAVSVLALAPAPASAATLKSGPLSYVSGKTDVGPGVFLSGSRNCPPSSKVTGGGTGFKSSTVGSSLLAADMFSLSFPGDPDDGFLGRVYNAGSSVRTLTTTAICLRKQENLLSYQTKSGTVPASFSSLSANEPCLQPALAVGGGAALETTDVQAALDRSAPVNFQPDLFADGWRVALRKPAGMTAGYGLTAVCTDPNALDALDLRYRTKAKAFTGAPVADTAKSLRISCPGRSRAVSGGVESSRAALATRPYDGKDRNKAPDDGWEASGVVSQASQGLTVHVICLA